MYWYFIKSGPKPRAPLTCPGSAASSVHAPFPTWKTPPSPPSPALPLLTDSTKLNCTKHTSENLINIVWKYNWGLTEAWIFHFEAKISALIYGEDLVLQIAMTAEINVNPSYAFPHKLQSLSAVSPGHTSPGRAAETPKHPSPALSRLSKRDQKHPTHLGCKILRRVGAAHRGWALAYPWIRFCVNTALGTSVDGLVMNIYEQSAPQSCFTTPELISHGSYSFFQSLQRNLYQFVPNSLAITETLGDNRKGLSGFNLKLCVLIS